MVLEKVVKKVCPALKTFGRRGQNCDENFFPS